MNNETPTQHQAMESRGSPAEYSGGNLANSKRNVGWRDYLISAAAVSIFIWLGLVGKWRVKGCLGLANRPESQLTACPYARMEWAQPSPGDPMSDPHQHVRAGNERRVTDIPMEDGQCPEAAIIQDQSRKRSLMDVRLRILTVGTRT